MTPSLAIIVPAFKPEFLREALGSLAAQTDPRFRVYVGDDAGPPAIGRICASARGLDLVYRRYDENLGGHALAAQWNRCIRLSTEPWIWLFSDDDLMAPDTVASLLSAIEGGEASDLIRVNTEVIDAHGEVIEGNPRHPTLESGVDFLFARLVGQRQSYAVEYAFRRETFERAGGFSDYPAAWCADDVAWYRFAERTGIRTLPGGRISWRASGLNISKAKRRYLAEKLTASARFTHFIREVVIPADRSGRTPRDWERAAERWYLGQVRCLLPLGPRLWSKALVAAPRRRIPARLGPLVLQNAYASLRAWLGGGRRPPTTGPTLPPQEPPEERSAPGS